MRLKPVQSPRVEPGCLLPENFTGEWVNTANIDADVTINSTHITEVWHPDVARWRKAVYICMEQRDSRYMMARLTIDGCQVDYQCFDFVPRHHNVIRFRKGVAMIKNDFHTVCSWVQFKNDIEWKYDLMLSMSNAPSFLLFKEQCYHPMRLIFRKGPGSHPLPCGGRVQLFSARRLPLPHSYPGWNHQRPPSRRVGEDGAILLQTGTDNC